MLIGDRVCAKTSTGSYRWRVVTYKDESEMPQAAAVPRGNEQKTHLGWFGRTAPEVQGIPCIPSSTQPKSGSGEIAAASVSECSLYCRPQVPFFRGWVSSIVGSICGSGQIRLVDRTAVRIVTRSGQSRCLDNASISLYDTTGRSG